MWSKKFKLQLQFCHKCVNVTLPPKFSVPNSSSQKLYSAKGFPLGQAEVRKSWPLKEPRNTIFIGVKARNLIILNSILLWLREENEQKMWKMLFLSITSPHAYYLFLALSWSPLSNKLHLFIWSSNKYRVNLYFVSSWKLYSSEGNLPNINRLVKV